MTDKYELVRTKLEDKVFTPYGQTVILKSPNSPTLNDRGETTTESWTETSITVVPYNIISHKLSHQPFGELNEGEQDMAVPYTVTIDKGYEIVYGGEDFIVTQIEKNPLPENTVTIIRVTRKQS